jgi:hypothetical protein
MLKSFFKGFDPGAIEAFVVICPDKEYIAVRQIVEEAVPNNRISVVEVVAESSLFSMCGLDSSEMAGLSGWQIQQIIKLCFARVCKTDFYLTIDSDIVLIQATGLGDLFPDGTKALAGVETADDYRRLYKEDFSAAETAAKMRYYQASQQILGYDRPASRAGIFYSETPVLLHKSSAVEMLNHLHRLHSDGIVAALSKHQSWTEYSLYFQYLEMSGQLDKNYICEGCNAVLSLEKSVWQPTAFYKSPRIYDRDHFTRSPLVRQGPFVAIQSWIPLDEWLASSFGGLADFYRYLEGWLDLSSSPSAPELASHHSTAPDLHQSGQTLASVNPAALLRILEEVDPSSPLYQRTRDVLEDALVSGPAIPKATVRGEPKLLTIGMTTHSDFDGCYFTIHAIRLYHPEILDDVEFLVIDNDPAGPCAKPLKALENWIPNYRYVPYRSRQSTAVRDLIFRDATSEFVLCVDCHVLFPPGGLGRLLDYLRQRPDSNDLFQGPLVSDALEPLATHFEPVWSQGMFGQWGMDDRGKDMDSAPFEIGMQGLGVFACRRAAWPGFNSRLAGFGGEEGYIHEKIRRAGGRNVCLPFLRWMHRFERPMGVPYRSNWGDRIRNYLLIDEELQLDPAPVIRHFEEFVGKDAAQELVQSAQAEIAGPFHFFDAIYCINLDRHPHRWESMQRRFRKLGIDRGIRRFPAVETALSHHIGCALSHRRIIAEAKQQQLKTVLVFEDDTRFAPGATDVLMRSLRELEGRQWQLLYLGGYLDARTLQKIPGCEHLVIPSRITCTHAIAYHHSVYDAILDAIPESAVGVALWIREHLAIDQFYTASLGAASLLTWPVIATQSSILEAETGVFED